MRVTGRMLCREYGNSFMSWILTFTTILVILYFILLATGALDSLWEQVVGYPVKSITGETGLGALKDKASEAANKGKDNLKGGR